MEKKYFEYTYARNYTGNKTVFGSLNWKEIRIINMFFITFAYFLFLRNNELDEVEYNAHFDNDFIFHTYIHIYAYTYVSVVFKNT